MHIVGNGAPIDMFSTYEEKTDRFELQDRTENSTILDDGREIYREKFALSAFLPKDGSIGTLHYTYTRKLYTYINGVHVPTGQFRVVRDLKCSATLKGITKSPPPRE